MDTNQCMLVGEKVFQEGILHPPECIDSFW
jgi:hypothetical protein